MTIRLIECRRLWNYWLIYLPCIVPHQQSQNRAHLTVQNFCKTFGRQLPQPKNLLLSKLLLVLSLLDLDLLLLFIALDRVKLLWTIRTLSPWIFRPQTVPSTTTSGSPIITTIHALNTLQQRLAFKSVTLFNKFICKKETNLGKTKTIY